MFFEVVTQADRDERKEQKRGESKSWSRDPDPGGGKEEGGEGARKHLHGGPRIGQRSHGSHGDLERGSGLLSWRPGVLEEELQLVELDMRKKGRKGERTSYTAGAGGSVMHR